MSNKNGVSYGKFIHADEEPEFGSVSSRHPRLHPDVCVVSYFRDRDKQSSCYWCYSLGRECDIAAQAEKFKKCGTYLGYCTGFFMADSERWLDYKKRLADFKKRWTI